MKKYLYLALGGFAGAVLRYFIKNLQLVDHNYSTFYNTMVINVLGCFMLSLFLSLTSELWNIDSDLKLGISVGFLGSFTTFSSLCKDAVSLFITDYYFSFLYFSLSAMLGFAAVCIGNMVGNTIIKKTRMNLTKKSNMNHYNEA